MTNTDRYTRRRQSPDEGSHEHLWASNWDSFPGQGRDRENLERDQDHTRDWERYRDHRRRSSSSSCDQDLTPDTLPPRGPAGRRRGPGGGRGSSGSGGAGRGSPNVPTYSSLPELPPNVDLPPRPEEPRRADSTPMPKKSRPSFGSPLTSPSAGVAKMTLSVTAPATGPAPAAAPAAPAAPAPTTGPAPTTATAPAAPAAPTVEQLQLPLPTSLSHTARKGSELLMAILQRSRRLGEFEREKAALDRMVRKREAEDKLAVLREAEYPGIASILKKDHYEDEQKTAQVVERIEHSRTELTRQCRELLHLLGMRDGSGSASAGGSGSAELDQEVNADLAKMREANAALEKSCADLQKEVAQLRAASDVRLAGLAEQVAKMEARQAEKTGVTAEEMEKIVTPMVATLASLQSRVEAHEQRLSAMDPAQLQQMGDFLVQGRPDMAREMAEQKQAVASLREQMAQTRGLGGPPVPAPAPAFASASASIAFPGDDFTSVRMEIGRLNEKLAALASLPESLASLTTTQAELMATQTDNMDRVYRAHDKLAETFGKLLNGETVERQKEVEELRQAVPTADVAERVQQLERDVRERYAALQMMMTTLDTQYNNLSTKELFTAIVGHMEKLCPNARQLQQDVQAMNRRLRQLEASVAAQGQTGQAGHTGQAGQTGQTRRLPGSNRTSSVQGSPADQTAKRRKLNGE